MNVPKAFISIFLLLLSWNPLSQFRGLGTDNSKKSSSSANLWCESWKLSVEVHNLREWRSVPPKCVDYVGRYMKSGQYDKDLQLAVREARSYAHGLNIVGDGKDAWIFDIDETTLSNLGYYEQIDFGGSPYNRTKYFEWVMEEKATAIQATLSFYNDLRAMGFSIFFITGRRHMYRNVTAGNLLRAGYKHWSGLLMREPDDKPSNVQSLKIAKRTKLEEDGYKIWGNMGDQWSDITGEPSGLRTFKVPNPMYYVG
uniref:Acid phosphatase n=1 Tax=Araucaria cunninghamii TaxID=56994 RepID=A0A0D6RB72_ARACU